MNLHASPLRLIVRKLWLLTALAVTLPPLTGQSPSAPSPVSPAEAFFQPLDFALPKLSPNGTKLCAMTRVDEAGHYQLTLIELPSLKSRPVLKTEGMSVINFWWKTDSLLLTLQAGGLGREFESLDLNTMKVTTLGDIRSYWFIALENELPDDPERMLFSGRPVGAGLNLLTINLRNGREQTIEEYQNGVSSWLTNRTGQAIGAWGRDGKPDNYFLLGRSGPGAKWQKRSFTGNLLPEMIPLAVAPDQRRLIVKDYRNNPTARICYYDPAADKLEEVVAARDVEPEGVTSWGRDQNAAAITYRSDVRHSHFIIPEAESFRRWIETKLPGTIVTEYSFSRSNDRIIVYARTDRNPGVYLLADQTTKKLTPLGTCYRGINPAKMSPTRHFRFTAADGLPLTGRITLPTGIAQPPLIVMMGPKLEGPATNGEFDNVAQFFASRGYATARIFYRGTTGFGRDFSAAGDFQIKTGIAQDLTAGIKWLAAQGWIDGARVAAFAEERGGLIAFPLAARSGLFKALVNFNTPMDIGQYTITNYATSDRSQEELFAAIGGRKPAEAYEKSVYPLPEVEHLTIPSFHYYDLEGDRFPEDGFALQAKLKKGGQVHEVLFGKPAKQILKEKQFYWKETAQHYAAAADFLDKYLTGPGPAK
jgi:hypothetical protein